MLKRILNKLPLTRVRIFGARILYILTRLFFWSNKQIVTRNGIKYELDLTEGIDFSIFLFGNFQKHIFREDYFKFSENPIIFDIGANIGHMALTYANLFPSSKIFAFEPTDYAYEKLKKNLSINPKLSSQIIVVKAFVSEKAESIAEIKAFSSWKINGSHENNEVVHPIHLGTAKKATQTPSFKLDDFVIQNNIQKIDFIKIDTDGHEVEVFLGSRETIKKFKPVIIFEAGFYVLSEKQLNFNFYFDFFKEFNYTFINTKNGHKITEINYMKEIPEKSTTDIMVIFNTQ